MPTTCPFCQKLVEDCICLSNDEKDVMFDSREPIDTEAQGGDA
jgi:hypothetical protein